MKKIKKLDNEVFNAKAQLAVLRTVAERIYKLKKDTVDPEAAMIEIELLMAHCFNGFMLNYISMPEICGDAPPMTDEFMQIRDSFIELLHEVCGDYQPFVTNG